MNQAVRALANNRRCLVMGLGAFGGGLGVTKTLIEAGAKQVLVTDLAPAEKLSASLAALQPLIESERVVLRLGEHLESDFQAAEVVIANPAVPKPWHNRFLLAARAVGATVTTELRLALEGVPRDRVIAITGSAGKSTTSAMVAHMLHGHGRTAILAGNIGGSLLQLAPALGARDWLVLELSSFMLWWLGAESCRNPWVSRIGALTNLSDNHLDWHGDASHYSRSKSCICGVGQSAFLTRFDRDDAATAHKFAMLPAGAWWRDATTHTQSETRTEDAVEAWQQMQPAHAAHEQPSAHENLHTHRAHGLNAQIESHPELADACPLPGLHNRRNAMLALQIAHAALACDGELVQHAALAQRLRDFRGLPHRLALVHEHHGVRWFDDSKATTPEATLLALSCFADCARVHLIAGGYDKGSNLSAIAALAPQLAGLYAIGATTNSLCSYGGNRCETLENAVQMIRAKLKPLDVVLLSPGCASWDQFENYEDRGRQFAALALPR